MKTIIREKIKELDRRLNAICPERKALMDCSSGERAEFHEVQYAQTILKELIGEN